MKKTILVSLAFALFANVPGFAQLNSGGIPLSFQLDNSNQSIQEHSYALPNWDSAAKISQEQEMTSGISKPYLIGLFDHTDVGFPNSGDFITNKNGQTIWRTKIHIQDAPAIGLYFSQFQLPEGVKLYLTNENKRQILGAYTSKNNTDDNLFAIEAVEGDVVNLELDIDPGVNLNDIKLHIDKALVYFRSISYLSAFADENLNKTPVPLGGSADQFGFEGNSSTCEINAICPQGADYPKQREAACQIIIFIYQNGQIVGAGLCSATMVNNTGNSSSVCKQYLLTATHCDGSNSTSSSSPTFSQMLVRFNFEKSACTGGPAATVNTMTGANFRARASYTETSTPHINGDFLLLELKNAIPSTWNVYLAGWDRDPNTPTSLVAPQKFIEFHHPSGDVKKLASTQDIDPNGDAGGSDGPGTHWQTVLTTGGIEQGSSGSALFNGDGRIIGIASIGGNPINSCSTNGKGQQTMMFNYAAYSKISYDWLYTKDGTSNIHRLQPWLDPGNTGVLTTDAIKSTCSDITTGIQLPGTENLGQYIGLFPNPSSNGIVNVAFNLKNDENFIIKIYAITGALQKTFYLRDVKSNSYNFDLSDLSNGMYLVKFDNGVNSTVKKLTLLK